MSRETIVFIFGITIFFLPHLGIPSDWKNILISGLGVLLIIIGYSLRRKAFLDRIDNGNGERGTDSFVEATEPLFDEESKD